MWNTSTHSTQDWQRLTQGWQIIAYPIGPDGMPVDKPTTTYTSQIELLREKTWDEIMEEVLEDRTEAWERLANL